MTDREKFVALTAALGGSIASVAAAQWKFKQMVKESHPDLKHTGIFQFLVATTAVTEYYESAMKEASDRTQTAPSEETQGAEKSETGYL